MLGELFDAGRGQNMAGAYDPLAEVHQAQTGIGLRLLVWAVLLLGGAGEELLESLGRSFSLVRGGGFDFAGAAPLGLGLLRLMAAVFGGIVRLFLPFAALFFAVDAAIGFVSKLVPAGTFCGEAFQLKTCLGLVILIALVKTRWPAAAFAFSRAWSLALLM